jgi:excisionase family DNA binding protein
MTIATAKEVAEYLKLTESTVYNLAHSGNLSGFKIGKSWRFDLDEILRDIRQQQKITMDKRREAEDDGGVN